MSKRVPSSERHRRWIRTPSVTVISFGGCRSSVDSRRDGVPAEVETRFQELGLAPSVKSRSSWLYRNRQNPKEINQRDGSMCLCRDLFQKKYVSQKRVLPFFFHQDRDPGPCAGTNGHFHLERKVCKSNNLNKTHNFVNLCFDRQNPALALPRTPSPLPHSPIPRSREAHSPALFHPGRGLRA